VANNFKIGDKVLVYWWRVYRQAVVTQTREHSLSVKPNHVQVRIEGLNDGDHQVPIKTVWLRKEVR